MLIKASEIKQGNAMTASAAHAMENLTSIENIIAEYQPKPIYEILEKSAREFADRPAIFFDGNAIDYKTLAHLADRAAAGLQAMGVKKGVKVGLFLPNTPFSMIAYYGVLKAGGTVVNYNPLYAAPELAFQVEDSETDVLITLGMPALKDKADALLDTTRLNKIVLCAADPAQITSDSYVLWDEMLKTDAVVDLPTIDPIEDVAVLQYTGGTTGTPKAAMLTHANLYINAVQFEKAMDGIVTPGQDRMLGVLPLFHVFAMTVVMNCAIWAGMEVMLYSRFDPKQLAPDLKDHTPTFLPMVPAMFAAIAMHKDTKDIDLSSVKLAISGGAPIAPEIKALFEKTCNTKIVEAYGLTETSPAASVNPPQGVIKSGSVGLPVSDTTIEIVSLDDGKTAVKQGEKGEVVISGPQVMKGYFNKPEETADVLRNGRLHTGDIGYLDEDGYLFLVDRLKDMILVSGFNVYPTQIEAAVHEHECVEECIVAGVADEKRGEAVYAWVKLKDGAELEEMDLKKFLRDKISATEMPRRIIFKNEPLPKTAVGKLSRKLLLEQEGYSA